MTWRAMTRQAMTWRETVWSLAWGGEHQTKGLSAGVGGGAGRAWLTLVRHVITRTSKPRLLHRPISVHRLGEMPIQIQSYGQSVSAPRGNAGARLNAHIELRTKCQRLALEVIYRNRPIKWHPLRWRSKSARPYGGGLCIPLGRGLHSSTSQLNLSRFWHKMHPTLPLTPPKQPPHNSQMHPMSHRKRLS